jgi:hypothetical protein
VVNKRRVEFKNVEFTNRIAGPDGQNLPRLSKGLNLAPAETRAVIDAVAPEIRHYLEARTLSRGGLADVVTIMGNDAQRQFLAPDTDLTSPDAIQRGNNLLDQIWQTKYRSRLVADRAAQATDVPAEKIRRMLPRLANLTFAALAEETQPALADVFSRFTGFPTNTTEASRSPGLGPGQSPLPLPQDTWGGNTRNRYDDLSDILKRQGGPMKANPLWSIVREIIGSAMGFQSKGIIGYIVRFLVYRYGWRILSAVLGGLFGGRR